MMPPSNYSCWVLTEDAVGMTHQAIGLATALGLSPLIKLVNLVFPWTCLPNQLAPLSLSCVSKLTQLIPPWPDVLISCGRKSVIPALSIKRASPRTRLIHIQNPLVNVKHFNCVIVPKHDHLTGPNVYVTQGAIHHITADKISQEKAKFSDLFKPFSKPLVGVLVGGTSSRFKLTREDAHTLCDRLERLAIHEKVSLAVVTSRRTPMNCQEIFEQRLGKTHYVWNRSSENPYIGLLGWADYWIVTSDSVSMISEAASTGKPIYLYSLTTKKPLTRFTQFYQMLYARHIARPFADHLEIWQYEPLNETQKAADFVRNYCHLK